MTQFLPRSKYFIGWLLVIPTIAWFYIGLFLTMLLWYPAGVSTEQWQSHLLHFSIVYVLWLLTFFSYRLFDMETLRATQSYLARLFAVIAICLVIAVLYFYFQPALLITPRRFLLVHLLISTTGIVIWYALIRRAVAKGTQRDVYIHATLSSVEEAQLLITHNEYLGLKFAGIIQSDQFSDFSEGAIIVLPERSKIDSAETRNLFSLRNKGVKFVEYHTFHENLTRTVHLSVLSDLWFIDSFDYGTHKLFDLIKRIIDVSLGLVGIVAWIVTFPVIALLIKLTSSGPVLFAQQRIGQRGKTFTLYKYRTMTTGSASNTWTAPTDNRITALGKFLRATRLDELPQSLNVLKGDMSIVGPRPEQVNIVEQLRQQIPYYDERHIVKPGLTGWAQLHVYASTLEETKRKLQYDLYYIKHRSLLFDAEIILKTIYNIISFSGR